MATDFFERQSTARRNTKWLVAMFVLAVIGIVGTTFIATAIALGTWGGGDVPIELPTLAAGCALVIIVLGSLYKTVQLRGGGTVLAERLGGRRIYPNTTDQTERRLLNVVEEMALASGVPVPPVFLLHGEQGINAFAAGHSPSDAVIGVTRGCAAELSREQLQGVIAHEFSHILNGDMRINLRLIGVLHGILLMGLVGREVLRIAGLSGDSKKNKGAAFLVVAGLAFMLLGFLGVFFGNLIKAAISRQREFLADASAVQFTRNPEGISGALKRIGAAAFGSKLVSPTAAEASHMYFASGLNSLFATHPPLEQRIRRLDPQWNGEFPPAIAAEGRVPTAEGASAFVDAARDATAKYAEPALADVKHAAEQIASPTETHRKYVHQLVAALPPQVTEAAHEPYGARAIIFSTLLDRDADVRAAQLRALETSADANVFELTLGLVPAVSKIDVRARLPLVDMTLPALRAMSESQYREFADCFDKLVRADHRLALFEWALHEILMRHLRPQFEPVRPPQIRYYGLQRLSEQCSILLSALARECQHNDDVAFQAGARHLPEVPLRYVPEATSGLNELRNALEELATTAPKLRGRLIDACAACISADEAISVGEGELLRAICDMLDCPMPPLLPGQQVVASPRSEREHSAV
jgi:Zn-dependent protease with chaperone function